MMSAKEAQALGLRIFTTYRSCKKCGSFERYSSTGNCVTCAKNASKKYRAEGVAGRPALPNVPICLMVAGANLCAACPSAPTCPAKGRSDVLMRACLAFRNHAPVSAAQARQLGMTICKPAQACRKCGQVEWRRIGARFCLGCFERRLHV